MSTTSATGTRHIREVLPLGLIRDLLPARQAQAPRPPGQPSPLKVAIIRWLNEEL
ncbi:MAG TPA: hypothetical protein VNA24_29185 [Hyalangium sp.]|nr:hypothetical protein [Hyalangium sp.]